MNNKLNIFNYTDVQSYLNAYSQDQKRAIPKWTLGHWVKCVGLKNTSSLSKILKGQREPGPEITDKLAKYFKFDPKESEYFRDLIQLKKVKGNPRLSILLTEKIMHEHPGGRIRFLEEKTFSVISNWYFLSIRELVRSKAFHEDASWISAQFLYRVTAKEIQTAIQIMLDLNLLKRGTKNQLLTQDAYLDTPNDVANEAIRRYHNQMLEHAKYSLNQMPVTEREFSATTILMKKNNLPKAKEMMRKFKKEFERVFEEEDGDHIYQIQLQLFPVTKELKELKNV